MKLVWEIEEEDIKKVREFYNTHKEKTFVKNRIKKNVENNTKRFSKDDFWHAMVMCLLTTQQRSGPGSSVTRFICKTPFPLNYSDCKKSGNLETYVEGVITDFGGIRRGKTIGDEVKNNYDWLENNGGWQEIEETVDILIRCEDKQIERKSSQLIDKCFKGFGPKQSRNLLQL
jgi:hypothetical protein